VHVETPFGHQAIGVLLAPSHDVWRARIMTYPNRLWTIPGGKGTMKFVGDSAEVAEARAIAFVQGHIQAKRFLRGQAPVGHDAPRPAAASRFAATKRKRASLPLRWGAERAHVRGVTVNVSPDGMFIGAVSPESDGQSLVVVVDLDGQTIRLRGFVMWSRSRAEHGRPRGMGVRLSEPPSVYQAYVAAL
jgi:hypothetical protein